MHDGARFRQDYVRSLAVASPEEVAFIDNTLSPQGIITSITEMVDDLAQMLDTGGLTHDEILDLAQRVPELNQILINFGSALNRASVSIRKIHAE